MRANGNLVSERAQSNLLLFSSREGEREKFHNLFTPMAAATLFSRNASKFMIYNFHFFFYNYNLYIYHNNNEDDDDDDVE